MTECSDSTCDRPADARGMCPMHYRRWYRALGRSGRHLRLEPMDRFMRQVDKRGPVPDYRPELGPCWLWTGHVGTHGYGKFTVGRTSPRNAHRWLWEQINGPASPKLHLDHLCRVRLCVNPEHTELVTHSENIRRGAPSRHNAGKTHCPQGHPYNEANTFWNRARTTRQCRACGRERNRKRRVSARDAA